MGALPKSEPSLAEVVEINGKQMLQLPEGLHLKGRHFRVIENGDSIRLEPPRKVLSDDDWKLWVEDMRKFQEELGDFMPEGRTQPLMPSDDSYPAGFLDERKS